MTSISIVTKVECEPKVCLKRTVCCVPNLDLILQKEIF